ncbi:MAG: hypothetical protein HQL09_08290 [Nitrospirae bacterium]|nr:hypothetical protein [Nitrospirota bacterium]
MTPGMQKAINSLIQAVHEYEAGAEDPARLEALQGAAVEFIAAAGLKIKTAHHDSIAPFGLGGTYSKSE